MGNTAEAGAEQRIDDRDAVLQGRLTAGGAGLLLPGRAVEAQRSGSLEALEIDPGVALELLWRRGEDHSHVAPRIAEQARDHEPVAAVVALAAEHRRGPVGREPLDRGGGRGAGTLHQLEALDALRLDRPAVDAAHRLGVGQGRQPGGKVLH